MHKTLFWLLIFGLLMINFAKGQQKGSKTNSPSGAPNIPGLGNFGKESLCKIYNTQKDNLEKQIEAIKGLLAQSREAEKYGREIISAANSKSVEEIKVVKIKLKDMLQNLLQSSIQANQPLVQMAIKGLVDRFHPSDVDGKSLEFIVNRLGDLLDNLETLTTNSEKALTGILKLFADKNC